MENARAFPPLSILTALAFSCEGLVVWIGREAWPSPLALSPVAIRRSLFIAPPPEGGARVWAIDQALRCPAVKVVVADGSGLDMASSRRLQLAAESGAIGLLARPPQERRIISAAESRWQVMPDGQRANGPLPRPRWRVELLRCKGMPLAESRSWIIETTQGDGHASALCVSANVADRSIAEKTHQGARRTG